MSQDDCSDKMTGEMAIRMANDPRVTAVVRWLNLVLAAICSPFIIAIFTKTIGFASTQEKMMWQLEQIDNRLSKVEKQSEGSTERIDSLTIEMKVLQAQTGSYAWRINRLERAMGR